MEYLSSSFNGMCPEEADFMSQLLGNFSLPNEVSNFAVSSALWPPNDPNVNVHGCDENAVYSAHQTNAGYNAYSFSQGSSYSGSRSILFPSCSPSLYNNSSISMDYSMNVDGEIQGSQDSFIACNVMEGGDYLNQDASNGSRQRTENVLHGKNIHLDNEPEAQVQEPPKEDKINCPSEGHKKRPRTPAQFQRSKRSMKLKNCADVDDSNDNNIDSNYVKGTLFCSEDDSNVSHDMSENKRASRGSATDPQSLYARKRRERINERLKILQNLVPNGTKVDISTMLEEAVQYVKFLQLQIKLLSSDELWMYAPIANNGMDIGLTPKSQS